MSMDDIYLSREKLKELKEFEAIRHSILKNEEETWRLKSRALSLAERDNNTKYVHQFSNLRKKNNTIWEINNV